MSRAHAYDRARAATQITTAKKWASLAKKAYARAARTRRREDLMDAEDHRHEALEHAALVSDLGQTVARIERSLEKVRERAWEKKR